MNTTRDIASRGRVAALTGVWLQLGPLFGLLGTVIGMIQGFRELGSAGIASPERLSSSISTTLIATMIGLVIGLIGMVFIYAALFYYRFRARWFVWIVAALSVLQLFAWPIGTCLAVVTLAFLIYNREYFFAPNTAEPPRPAEPSSAGAPEGR